MHGEVAAPKGVAGEEATPRLAGEGGADKDNVLFQRDADDDLLHKFLHLPQLPNNRRRHHGRKVFLMEKETTTSVC